MYKLLLLRYGELGLKGKNKGQFIKCLADNIKRALDGRKVINTWGRLWVELDGSEEDYAATIATLKNVFGLYSVSPVVACGRELPEIAAAALRVLTDALPAGGSFKFESRRSDKSFPLTSPELSAKIGALVLPQVGPEYTVDVRNPERRIDIEVRNEGVYVYGETIPMAGGLPVGCGGKAVVMLSGGIDSPVAAYLAMKRGVKVELVHFHSFPFTSERAKEKVIDLAQVLTKYDPTLKLHVIHFTDIQTAIRDQCREDYMITMMRRYMYRIAERMARKHKAWAIYTGESVGQVASQTLESMAAINECISLPVLRPLCGFDKEEIIAISQKIGAFEISIRPYEDCCTIFLPEFPKIRPHLEDCLEMEAKMDVDGLIEQALEKSTTLVIRQQKE